MSFSMNLDLNGAKAAAPCAFMQAVKASVMANGLFRPPTEILKGVKVLVHAPISPALQLWRHLL